MKLSGAFVRSSLIAMSAISSAMLIAACGGGGGTGSAAAPTVASASAGTPKYGQKLLLTVSGSNLDQGLSITATACTGIALSTTAPSVSTATTAYYQCTVSASGAGQFVLTRTSDNATLTTTPFNVPVPQVTMTVSNGAEVNGAIVVTLAPNQTPLTVDNFLAYVNARFYDGTVFHRVSPGFVIQGGGYASPVDNNAVTPKATSAPIALEVGKGLSNTQWTIAMARDPAVAASATSQFFINLVDNSAQLDPSDIVGAGYAVFGNVVASSSTVAAIAGAPCTKFPDRFEFYQGVNDCTLSPNVVVTSAVQTR